ncbi:MAG: DNA sulfur modification protein DndE [Planctomyces sp.]|nr:DNA sulfur modification protein DndE [Planctomyces sp.]
MTIRQIKLSQADKDHLIKLKRWTKIENWNTLCRWAFCLSLRDRTPPTPIDLVADSNVEMTWAVFGGDNHEIFLAAITERCARDGLGTDPDTLNRQFRLHLHRGIGKLATPNRIKSISDLIRLALDQSPAEPAVA